MKRALIVAALLIGLAVAAQAQRTSVYFGVGINPGRPVVAYAPAYPVLYGPGYPVFYRGCGPACQHERWERERWQRNRWDRERWERERWQRERWGRERWREREWREREQRERRWRHEMCERGNRRYCGW